MKSRPSYPVSVVASTLATGVPVRSASVFKTSAFGKTSKSSNLTPFFGQTARQKLEKVSPCASDNRTNQEESSSSSSGLSGTGQALLQFPLSSLGASSFSSVIFLTMLFRLPFSLGRADPTHLIKQLRGNCFGPLLDRTDRSSGQQG